MGPYSSGTSHTTGAFFEIFYEQPIFMLALVAVAAGLAFFVYRRNKNKDK